MLPKILICVGARPNFVKVAPIIRELRNTCSEKIIYEIAHTGQHYDPNMSEVFFNELEIPLPVYYFGCCSGKHPASQLSRYIANITSICVYNQPDLVLVIGDVTSTLACALAANKCKIPIAHVESGERSYDKSMPEEINRILIDNISTYLFCSTVTALDNLAIENIDCTNAFFVGNTMVDSLLHIKPKLTSVVPSVIKQYAVVTIHREYNTDNRGVLRKVLIEVNNIAKKLPVFFPAHPRTQKRITDFDLEQLHEQITILPPMSYIDFLSLVQSASLVITDSGGVQIEAGVLRTPCVTVRETTEHIATINAGINVLTKADNIFDTSVSMLKKQTISYPDFGDGKASVRIVQKLMEILNV